MSCKFHVNQTVNITRHLHNFGYLHDTHLVHIMKIEFSGCLHDEIYSTRFCKVLHFSVLRPIFLLT